MLDCWQALQWIVGHKKKPLGVPPVRNMPHYNVWAAFRHYSSQTVSNAVLVINGVFCHWHYWGSAIEDQTLK